METQIAIMEKADRVQALQDLETNQTMEKIKEFEHTQELTKKVKPQICKNGQTITGMGIKHIAILDRDGNMLGEPYEALIVNKDVDRDFKKGWRRVFIKDLFAILSEIAGKKFKVCEFIFDNLDTDNKFCYTIAKVAEKTNVSRSIVVQTFSFLKDKNVIAKGKGDLFYTINPELLSAFGSNAKNRSILIKYNESRKS